MEPSLQAKRLAVEAALGRFSRVIVAFSGGVDSTLLAALARQTLGRTAVLAVTADSPSLAREDLREAAQLAARLDLDHRVIRTAEVDDPAYRANSPGRCYICKGTLFAELELVAQRERFDAVLYGAIEDDLREARPGAKAAAERGVRAPLQEAGCAKWDVRELARELGLPNWDRPQNACLSSRVPHGQPVTEEKLRQVEAAEAFLRAQGFALVRVRLDGRQARVEVEPELVARLLEPAMADAVARHLSKIGFDEVAVDRRGYRAGGANLAATHVVSLHSAV